MDSEIQNSLSGIVGQNNIIINPDDQAKFLIDHREYYTGKTPAVVFPQNTRQVADIVRFCRNAKLAIVPQGGNTGYGGGATPDRSGRQLLVRMDKMDRVREIDTTGFTMTVEAGVILANLQQAALHAGMFFPLSLGAEGSCQIGGNISTNAGGLAVLKYGNTRDLVLGIEAVLPDGEILSDLKQLRKDNTGYNLAQLFTGAEGSLGIITAAVLKTFPVPEHRCCVMLAFDNIEKLYSFYRMARQQSADCISSFEYISRLSVELLANGPVDCPFPLDGDYRHYALVEFSSSSDLLPLQDMVEKMLTRAMEDGLVLDGAMAASENQRLAMWRVREAIPETERMIGGSIKHDISVPLSAIGAFLHTIPGLLDEVTRDRRDSVYGHIGDGNLHYNLLHLPDEDPGQFKSEHEAQLSACMYDLAVRLGGSFSAEHGIGQLKLKRMKRYKDPRALALMKSIKQAIDPDNIMNPGKLVPMD